ncbi:MAG: hypothetical protein PVF46_09375, partial [Lysobacterales bacterium]
AVLFNASREARDFEPPPAPPGQGWSLGFCSAPVQQRGQAWALEAQSLACLVLETNILHVNPAE